MENIIDIRKYRRKKQNQFLDKHKNRIDRIIFNALQKTMFVEIDKYLEFIARSQSETHSFSWDYISYRDIIIECLDRQIGDVIYSNLNKSIWFDKRWFTRDQMLERAMTNIVLKFPGLASNTYRSA